MACALLNLTLINAPVAWRVAATNTRYRLRSVDELRACLCRFPDGIRVEVERGLAMSAETVTDLRSLSTLPPGLVLVITRFDLVVRLERA
jgi:hypothetical protein